MKKEKRKTNIYFAIIILLILSLFCGIKFFGLEISVPKKEVVAENENKQKLEKKHNDENSTEDIDLNSDLAKELQQKISIFDDYTAGSYYGYFYQEDYKDINNITNDAKVVIGITQQSGFSNDFANATYNATTPDNQNIKVIILSKEEISAGINAFFGPNTYYQDTDLKDADYDYCGFSRFKFDNTRNVYISDPFTCNAFPKPHIDSKITKIYKNGKVVEVTIKIAYIKYETNEKEEVTKLVYKHLNDQNPLEKHVLLTDNSYDINNILGKLDTYKFTFTLNSNNYYYFTKVEKI